MRTFVSYSVFLACLLSLSLLFGQTPPPPTQAAAAMNTGLQHLKDSKWQQAAESFDLAVMLAPAYAPAYMGKLCAALQVTEEKLLGDLTVGIDEHRFFKSALEHADPGYKRQIQGYADAINAKVKAMVESVKGKDDHKAGDRTVLTIQGVEYAFRWCPSGTFTMGSPEDESNRSNNETPHQVKLSRGFWMLETEVTQAMWKGVMGSNPSSFKGSKHPVECVSWNNCQEYIKKLNDLGVAPKGYRFSLPTEAQWEYACRAGTTTAFCFGDTLTDKQANFGDNVRKPSEVGKYPANAWGLHDMHGNVCEWCADWYGDYPNGNVTDPTGAVEGSRRVLRGGGWGDDAGLCRSASLFNGDPSFRFSIMGLRVSLVSSD